MQDAHANPPAQPGEVQLDARLLEIFREVFGQPAMALRRDATPEMVPDWDSMRMMSLLMAMEERFGITVRASQIRALRTAGDLEGLLP